MTLISISDLSFIVISALTVAAAVVIWLRIRKIATMKYFSLLTLITGVSESVRFFSFVFILFHQDVSGFVPLLLVGVEVVQLLGWFLVVLFISGVINGIHLPPPQDKTTTTTTTVTTHSPITAAVPVSEVKTEEFVG